MLEEVACKIIGSGLFITIESIIEQTSHELQQALEQGESIEPILENWFLTNPQVIVQILLEQRVQHPVFANSVFNYTENLEAIVSPEELYTELGKQMQPHADAFMDVVVERHPTSLWLIVENIGVFILGEKSFVVQRMLESLAEIYLRINNIKNINLLKDNECKRISNMEQEKYRINILKED